MTSQYSLRVTFKYFHEILYECYDILDYETFTLY